MPRILKNGCSLNAAYLSFLCDVLMAKVTFLVLLPGDICLSTSLSLFTSTGVESRSTSLLTSFGVRLTCFAFVHRVARLLLDASVVSMAGLHTSVIQLLPPGYALRASLTGRSIATRLLLRYIPPTHMQDVAFRVILFATLLPFMSIPQFLVVYEGRCMVTAHLLFPLIPTAEAPLQGNLARRARVKPLSLSASVTKRPIYSALPFLSRAQVKRLHPSRPLTFAFM